MEILIFRRQSIDEIQLVISKKSIKCRWGTKSRRCSTHISPYTRNSKDGEIVTVPRRLRIWHCHSGKL